MKKNTFNHPSLPEATASAIIEDIKKQIISQTLPGYRKLMERYNVSQPTAKLAISILESKGIVSPARKGRQRDIVLKKLQSIKSQKSLLLIQVDNNISYDEEHLTIAPFLRTWSNYHGHTIRYTASSKAKRPESTLKRVISKYNPDAIATFVLPLNWNTAVHRLGLPVYNIGGALPDNAQHSGCGYSQESATHMALERLRDAGHRKVLTPVPPRHHSMLQFIQSAYRKVFPEMNEDHLNLLTPLIQEDLPDVWQAFLSKHYYGIKPTAIITDSLPHLISVYDFCAKNNLNIPNDLSIVCEHDNFELAWFSPVPCRLQYPYEKQRQHFTKWIKSDCQWKNRKRLTLKWIEGLSIANLNHK